MKPLFLIASSLIFLPISNIAAAQERDYILKDSHVDFVFTAGYTNGGDDLIKLKYEDGEKEDIQAGGEALLGAGVVISWANSAELQLMAGYHFDSASAENGDASFERFPIEALLFRRAGRHRFGGGLTVHLSPSAEIDIDGSEKETVNFDAAPGFILEYDYSALENLSLGLRYTYIEYKSEGPFNTTRVDGNHFGLMVHFRI